MTLNRLAVKPLRFCLYSAICTSFLLFLLLFSISGCSRANTVSQNNLADTSLQADVNAIPHVQKQIQVSDGVGKGVLTPNHRVYFASDDFVPILDGTSLVDDLQMPKFDSIYGPIINDIGVNPATELVYVLDSFADVINVISDTTLITSLVGISGSPQHVVTDLDSGEVYVFYTWQINNKTEPHVLVLSGTTTVTDVTLPLFANAVAYNPIDGHIYTAGQIIIDGKVIENGLMVIDDHQVLQFVHPVDEPQLSVEGMAINEKNGDIYILLVSKVIYWDRVNPMKSIDLDAKGYKNLECITVDPIRGWAYVCAWTGHPSYALVIDKNILKAAIPIDFWPQSMAVDTKHDYVYVAHYDPAVMSVLRETKLITTVDTLGYGTMDVVVDEERNLIYVSNADDGSVTVFGFKEVAKESSWLDFLPIVQK